MGTIPAELDPWFVTGFLQAEGSFTYARNGRTLGPLFSLKRHEEDEPLLEELRSFFGQIGRIYGGSPRQRSTSSPRRQRVFRVTRRDELPVLVEHLDRYPLRGRRAGVYRVWRTLVLLKAERFRRADDGRLEALAAELSRLA